MLKTVPQIGPVWSANFTFYVTIPFVPHFHGMIYTDNTKNIERQVSLDKNASDHSTRLDDFDQY